MLPTSSLKFDYLLFPAAPNEAFPHRSYAKRPVINIKLLFDDKTVKYPVLIDSGADFCIFHAEIARDLLNLPVKKGKKLIFYGTGGIAQTAYFHNIQIDLCGYEIDLFAGFSFDMEKLPYGILGQTGFFDRFKIEFDYQGKRIEIKSKRNK
ncbi:retropepsin-like domain-containing protein [Candidatus Microgenomates bacterium]|nr:retropepsin-like domain-containing protein [Candidatus Microgenomates bacterium]